MIKKFLGISLLCFLCGLNFVSAKTVNLLIDFNDCPVTHDVQNNRSVFLGRFYVQKPDSSREYIGTCSDVGEDGVFSHEFKWSGKWQYNQNDAQRVLTRYIQMPDNKELIINDKEIDSVRYEYKDKLINYVHNDDTSPITNRESEYKGETIENRNKYLEYNGQVYNVPNSDFNVSVKHILVDRKDNRPFKYCSLVSDKKIHYYVDIIKRADGSTYKSDEYEEKNCE